MTDLECKKVAEVLGIHDAMVRDDGQVCVMLDDGMWSCLYIHEGSFAHALPLRVMKSKTHPMTLKSLVECLLKQAEDGICTMAAVVKKKPTKMTIVDKTDTLESLLIKHDLMNKSLE